MTGIILEGLSGFETQAPNLNTIYVRYISSGDDKITKTFAADQLLTVYDNTAPVESIVVNAGGSSFANSDQVQILPALTINVTSGSFIAGANVSQTIGANTANAIIVSIANVTNSNNKVIVVKPYNVDLSNTSLSAQKWSFVANATISTDGGSVVNVISVLGSAASGFYPPTSTIPARPSLAKWGSFPIPAPPTEIFSRFSPLLCPKAFCYK